MPPVHLNELLFPDRDVGFGRLIAELSEPETGPAADNLVSNEDSYPRVAGELARRTPREGVYLGVGPDQNYTLMARMQGHGWRSSWTTAAGTCCCTWSTRRSSLGRSGGLPTRLTCRRPGPLGGSGADELVVAFEAGRWIGACSRGRWPRSPRSCGRWRRRRGRGRRWRRSRRSSPGPA
ncbi:MAG: hypothetical protein WKF75_12010 [Singulisphaera sp.]